MYETHNDAEFVVSELQHFHKPTSELVSVSSEYFNTSKTMQEFDLNRIMTKSSET